MFQYTLPMLGYSLLLMSLAVSAFGISRGRPAGVDEYREVVRVTIPTKRGASCTGTAIEGCVLTAKHCVPHPSEHAPVLVLQGETVYETKLDDKGEPMFRVNPRAGADLALIRLARVPEAAFEATVLNAEEVPTGGTIAFGASGVRPEVAWSKKLAGIIVGYGRPGGDNGEHTRNVGTVSVMGDLGPVIAGLNGATSERHGKLVTLPEPSNIEPGDSGGPLFAGKKLVGVTIARSKPGGPDIGVSLYSDIVANGKWIRTTLSQLGCNQFQ